MQKNVLKYVSIFYLKSNFLFYSFDFGVKYDSNVFWTFVLAKDQWPRLW